MKNIFKKQAFTLAEIMIVLTVIGILTAILLPTAFQATPDENIMKFKKANTTLYRVINELVSSDKYYKDGDLGIRSDGSNSSVQGEKIYFCEVIADLFSTKKVNCDKGTYVPYGALLLSNEQISNVATGSPVKRTVTPETIQASKEWFDYVCKANAINMGQEIITTDNIVYYNGGTIEFGGEKVEPNAKNGLKEVIYLRHFSPPNQFPANYSDESGFDIVYKIFCIDVDGFDETKGSTKCDDIKDVCPFGYGIRADGKIMTGARADEWLKKSIQDKE